MKNITFEEAQKLVEQGELATAEERKILQKERSHSCGLCKGKISLSERTL